jgi:hypothetical protein
LLSRQPKTIEQSIRPLFKVKVKLDPNTCLVEGVYKDDTPITIFDRMHLNNQKHLGHLNKETRKQLQLYIEFEINQYIKGLESIIKKHEQANEQKRREHEQVTREKRLKAAQKLGDAEQLYSTNKVQSLEARKIIAKLSIIVAPNKRGDIVVREGQENESSVVNLVKNFIVCYGLKKEMFKVIYSNLINLIKSNLKQPNLDFKDIRNFTEEKMDNQNFLVDNDGYTYQMFQHFKTEASPE